MVELIRIVRYKLQTLARMIFKEESNVSMRKELSYCSKHTREKHLFYLMFKVLQTFWKRKTLITLLS